MGYYKLRTLAYLIQISLAIFQYGYSIALFNTIGDLMADSLS